MSFGVDFELGFQAQVALALLELEAVEIFNEFYEPELTDEERAAFPDAVKLFVAGFSEGYLLAVEDAKEAGDW